MTTEIRQRNSWKSKYIIWKEHYDKGIYKEDPHNTMPNVFEITMTEILLSNIFKNINRTSCTGATS